MKFKFLKENYLMEKSSKITPDEIKQSLKSAGVKLTEAANSSEFKAYITNLGKYNEGDLVGQWVSFPISESDFESVLDEIGIDDTYEEWFVTDYDCDVDAYSVLGEHPSFEQLDEFGELVEDDAFKAILEDQGNFDSAKSIYESGNYVFYPHVDSWEDFAYRYVDEMGGVSALGKDTLENNFDYGQLGRDLSFDSYEDDEGEEVSAGEYWCGDENATDEEIGEAYVDAVGFDGVANSDNYLDYEALGRELSYDGALTNYGILMY